MSDNIPPSGNEPQAFPPPPPPPPGYTPFGGFQPQMGSLPTTYGIPSPIPGQPHTEIPPTPGTIVDAWRSIATNFSRQNIAGWANAANDQWTIQSLIAGTGLSLVGSVISGIIILSGVVGIHTASVYAATALVSSQRSTIVSFIMTPIDYILGIFAFALGMAILMSPSYGDIQQRMRRAIKPVAIAAVPIGVISLIFSVLSSFSARNTIVNLANSLDATSAATALGTSLLGGCVVGLLGLAFAAYGISMSIQSGSVGSSLNRWPVFGGAVIGILIAIIPLIIVDVILNVIVGVFIH